MKVNKHKSDLINLIVNRIKNNLKVRKLGNDYLRTIEKYVM